MAATLLPPSVPGHDASDCPEDDRICVDPCQAAAQAPILARRLDWALRVSGLGHFEFDPAARAFRLDERSAAFFGLDGLTTLITPAVWAQRIHERDRGRVLDALEASIANRSPLQEAFSTISSSGSVKHLSLNAGFEDGDGSDGVLAGFCTDITSIDALTRQIDEKRLAAESASIAKSQFLATVSHELRTPMNALLGMLDLLLRSELGPRDRDMAATAYESAQLLLTLLNDILDFSKLEANQVTLEAIDFSPRELIQATLALHSAAASEKGLSLRADIDPALPAWLKGDPSRLKQVLINLVNNAIKFTFSGEVVVEAAFLGRAPRGILRLDVRDTGVGIPETARAKLFRRFSQADASTTRQYGGTGLGLAICKQLVELMGGSIGVDSEAFRGSTFWFALPLEFGQQPDVQKAAHTPRAKPALEAASRTLSILVVEDNALNQKLIRMMLSPTGHELSMANSGAEALLALEASRFDLVLMDIQMPVMDGEQAVRAIRDNPRRYGRMPVIALTAGAMPGDRERCLSAGMTDYVTKPINPDQLIAAIDRASGGRSGPLPCSLTCPSDPEQAGRSEMLDRLTAKLGLPPGKSCPARSAS